MSDERIQTLVGIPPKELDRLRRKAAAFDATIEHGIAVVTFRSKWSACNLYGTRLASGHATPLEAVEAAVKKLGET